MFHERPDGTRGPSASSPRPTRRSSSPGWRSSCRSHAASAFSVPKARFSDAELCYLTEVDGRDHVAIVAVLEDEPSQLAAVGRFVRNPQRRDEAEVAVIVGDPLQGMGLRRTSGPRSPTSPSRTGSAASRRRCWARNSRPTAISRRVQTHYADGLADLVVELETREHAIVPAVLAA
jgi:hypothetical protein